MTNDQIKKAIELSFQKHRREVDNWNDALFTDDLEPFIETVLKQCNLYAVVQVKPEKHFCELKAVGRGKRCKEQCEGCKWFEIKNKQK